MRANANEHPPLLHPLDVPTLTDLWMNLNRELISGFILLTHSVRTEVLYKGRQVGN
jgi:hypothetical protein